MKFSVHTFTVCLALLYWFSAPGPTVEARPVCAVGSSFFRAGESEVPASLRAQNGFGKPIINPPFFATHPAFTRLAVSRPVAIAYGATAAVITLLMLHAFWKMRGAVTLGHLLLSVVLGATVLPILALLLEYSNYCDTYGRSFLREDDERIREESMMRPRMAIAAWFVRPPLLMLRVGLRCVQCLMRLHF